MREFYFVMPEEKQIAIALNGFWNHYNFLISAKQFFDAKTNTFNGQLYPIRFSEFTGKIIMDSGAFQYIMQKQKFPFSPEDYAHFLSIMKPTYGVAMDFPCTATNYDLQVKDKNLQSILNSNENRIKESVKNAVLNIQYSKDKENYIPISVVQGFNEEDYRLSIQLLHEKNAVTDFLAIGSLAKRKKRNEIKSILKTVRNELSELGYDDLHIHAFGLSFSVLNDNKIRNLITSSDSASWIFSLKKFHRVMLYNKKRGSFQEVDLGFGSYHDWKKYIATTFMSYLLKINDLTKQNEKDNKAFNKISRFKIIKKDMNKIKLSFYNGITEEEILEMNYETMIIYNPQYHIFFVIPAMRNANYIDKNNVEQLNKQNISILNQDELLLQNISKIKVLHKLLIWDYLGMQEVKIRLQKDQVIIRPDIDIKYIFHTNFFKKGVEKYKKIMAVLKPISFSKTYLPHNIEIYQITDFSLQKLINSFFFHENKNYNEKQFIFKKKNKELQLIRSSIKVLNDRKYLDKNVNTIDLLSKICKYLLKQSIHSINETVIAEILQDKTLQQYKLSLKEVYAIGVLTNIFIFAHRNRITINTRVYWNDPFNLHISLKQLIKSISIHRTMYIKKSIANNINNIERKIIDKLNEQLIEQSFAQIKLTRY